MTVALPTNRGILLPASAVAQQLKEIEVQLIQQHKFLEALQQLMLLVHQQVTDPRIWLHIGFVYTRMAHWKQAISALETVLTLDAQDSQARQLLSLALFSTGQQDQACQLIDQVTKKKNASNTQWMMRAYLYAHASPDPMLALKVAQDWSRRFADPLTRSSKSLIVKNRDPRKKLKVGYVTADFREHSVAFFMRPVLEQHNPDSVEIHVYSNGPEDGVTAQLKLLVPYWHDVRALSDNELHAQIRRDEIDILVDLSGFTHGQRLLVFARRAAPVQVTWLGYMQTLGMKAMDYRLVDAGVAPESHAPFYSEALFHVGCMASYAPPTYSPLCEQPPMLRNGYPTLISLNSSAKITDEMLRTWGRILHARTDARLVIMVKEQDADAAQAHMLPRVVAANMPLERVSVMPQQALDRFMELGHIADVMLDTSPISGGTTTLHALWMGLSIVTMDAVRGVDASTARTLQGLRHGNEVVFGGEVVKDSEEYVQAALRLMDNPECLWKQRLQARERLQSSVLMDYAARTQELELAWRLMWINWLRGEQKYLNAWTVDVEQILAEMDHIA